MAAFEDDVIAFIRGRRPLKLLFMAIATVGVLGSAASTLRPVAEWAQPHVYRVLGVQLDAKDRDRLGCAYLAGSMLWTLPEAARVARSQGIAAWNEMLVDHAFKLDTCHVALGNGTMGIAPASNLSDAETLRVQAALLASLASLSGTLQAKDRLAYLIFRIGNEINRATTTLVASAPDERTANDSAALTPAEIQSLHSLSEALKEARQLCPCRLPDTQVETANRGAAVAVARTLDDAFVSMFAEKRK